MADVVDALSWALLMSGAVFLFVGGIGILRLPDFYCRIHAAGLTDTLGAGLILIGLMVQAGWTLVAVKLLLIFGFLFLTSPTATHALARAALLNGLKPVTGDEKDAVSKT